MYGLLTVTVLAMVARHVTMASQSVYIMQEQQDVLLCLIGLVVSLKSMAAVVQVHLSSSPFRLQKQGACWAQTTKFFIQLNGHANAGYTSMAGAQEDNSVSFAAALEALVFTKCGYHILDSV